MKTRNIFIIILMVIGITFFGIVQGIVIPRNTQNKQQYISEQKDPLTHDFKSVIKYKNKYMGNISNVSHLFRSLPLNEIGMSFELFPDTLTVEVDYKETVLGIGENRVNKALIYNSTAAFALIDNLEAIDFKFTGASYKVSRSEAEKWYGVKLSTLTEKDVWTKVVQSKLYDNEYVQKCTKAILQKE
jgi:hypothetical protein